MARTPQLTGRERLRRVFRCQPVDRMPIRLWGVDPMFPSGDPAWRTLYELTETHDLELIRDCPVTVTEVGGPAAPTHTEQRDSHKPGHWEYVTTIETPDGPLTQVHDQPKDGSPGYVTKHFIESVADARRWLSIPVLKVKVDVEPALEIERRSGERALLMVGLGQAMYTIQAMMGSETFGFWLMEERDLLHELTRRAFDRIAEITRQCLAKGVGDAYGWVGPELCIPPLASPRDFREFCFEYDRQIIDMVHDAGKLVWVHCHGDMNPVLEGFVEMGVDCLNPIEPPPIGKLTLADAKRRVGGRMCLEGGVQNGDFDLLEPEQMVARVEETVAQGKPGGGFILCPTSSPTTWPSLSERHIANHRAFVETGVRLRDYA